MQVVDQKIDNYSLTVLPTFSLFPFKSVSTLLPHLIFLKIGLLRLYIAKFLVVSSKHRFRIPSLNYKDLYKLILFRFIFYWACSHNTLEY
jgi:hypothetical protein